MTPDQVTKGAQLLREIAQLESYQELWEGFEGDNLIEIVQDGARIPKTAVPIVRELALQDIRPRLAQLKRELDEL